MDVPIYIPTKGRAGKCKTLESLLSEKNKNVIVVVEVQELKEYQEAYPEQQGWMILQDSDKGIAYARQSILRDARKRGLEWFWMLDDDITSMGEVKNQKVEKKTYTEVLSAALNVFSLNGDVVGIGALEYGQFAWSHTKPYAVNSYCDVAVCINVENTQMCNYRDIPLKEDRDFALQVLSDGYMTIRTSKYCFSAPANGSNEGGLHDEYAAGKERRGTKMMIAAWPGICTKHTKKDRNDVKINWRHFALKDEVPDDITKLSELVDAP